MEYTIKVVVDSDDDYNRDEIGDELCSSIYSNADFTFEGSCVCGSCDHEHDNEEDIRITSVEVVNDHQPAPRAGVIGHPSHP